MSILSRLFGLENKVALVTGASRGIGQALAQGLQEAGACVYGIARSSVHDGVVGAVQYRSCDVMDSVSLGNLIEAIVREKGRIDILVNAAGITLPAQFSETPAEAFRRTLDCNLTAVFEACRLVVPHMERMGGGSIVNVTSIGALLGFPGNPGYVASKGGLAAMTRGLALDYGPKGIRVNNLVPGYIHTAMTAASYEDPEKNLARASRTMLGRWGETQDLIGAAIFLASNASSYVTGSDLCVDGGWTAKGL